jgi:cytochrome bd-type quinol oxidase subunit 1
MMFLVGVAVSSVFSAMSIPYAKGYMQGPLAVDHATWNKTGTTPTWLDKYGAQIDQSFSGPLSFSHLVRGHRSRPDHCYDEISTPAVYEMLGRRDFRI